MDRKTLLLVILGTCAIAFIVAIVVLSSTNTQVKTPKTTITPTVVPGTVKVTPTFPPNEPEAARVLPTGPVSTAASLPKSTKPSRLFEVQITASGFNPNTTTISKGDVVSWTNKSSKSHKIIGKTWRSGQMVPGQAFAQQFDVAGTFTYFSETDPGMTGKIIVE